MPEMMVASAGTRSPGRTTMIAPTGIFSIGVSTSPFGVSTMRRLGGDIGQRLDAGACAPRGDPFEQFADSEEEHDQCGLLAWRR